MKFVPVLLGLALLSAPATAQVVHQASVVHNGQTVTLQYEPKVETSFRQHGLGPRTTAVCHWTSRLAVQRSAIGPDNQTIAALTRVVASDRTHSDREIGHCASVSDRPKTGLLDDDAALRSYLADIAGKDIASVQTELTSLASLHPGATFAR